MVPLKGMYGNIRENVGIVIVLVFPICSSLELRNKTVGLQIRILREISSLDPAPKVWKPLSRSENWDF